MADFCSVCSKEMFGENVKPEIDLDFLISELKKESLHRVIPPGSTLGYLFICEGCGMQNIQIDSKGNILCIFYSSDLENPIVYFYSPELVLLKFKGVSESELRQFESPEFSKRPIN
ncbi:MAG: hypothetical protein NUV97_00640 [archaeon]|nr:hypothetical protein [archaeon]